MLSLLLIFTIIIIIFYYKWVKTFPPGPFPLPIIGNLHQLATASHPHKRIEELGKEYGKVFTVFLPLPVVVVTGLEETREALLGSKGDNFSSRPDNPSDSLFMNIPNGGVIFSEGKQWNEQRAFTLSTLRYFGVGSQIMEQKIISSVQALFDHFDKLDLSCLDINWPVHLCVGNVIHEVLFGDQVPYGKAHEMRYFQDLIDEAMQMVRSRASVLVVQALPWTRHLPLIGYWGYWQLRNIALELIKYVNEQVQRVQEKDEGIEENFVSAYLREIKKREKLEEETSFNDGNLVNTVTDLWLAGMETAATTIRWAITLLTAHPKVQEKLAAELDEIVGDRMISMSDKQRLLYAQAVVCEIHRVSNVVTFNVFHKTYRDDTLAGHFIPAGTTVLPQVSAVLDDEQIFENAHEFNPERFIKRKNDGIELLKDEMDKVIAFSLGKRQCAGEALARMEVFLITLSIVQRYRLLPADSSQLPKLNPIFGILQTPKPFEWRLQNRKISKY
ncbi:unnamed protein product, partial [Mesorhabditis belari]|uniref:Cytochrome P450 n=1 Tax=Mesorhabditis belari TaxID=2138241 RepID=A0AAF3FIL5_9BILA